MVKQTSTVLLIIACAYLSACATQQVQAWERDVLAQKKMELNSYPLDTFMDEHIYYSKENSSGGQGVGGGGCGCN